MTSANKKIADRVFECVVNGFGCSGLDRAAWFGKAIVILVEEMNRAASSQIAMNDLQ